MSHLEEQGESTHIYVLLTMPIKKAPRAGTASPKLPVTVTATHCITSFAHGS